MKLLIIGSGAREHALAWKFLQDDPTIDIIAAPGNPGIATLARCLPVRADDVDGLVALARAERPDLTVVGPEAPLALGIVDRFDVEGFPIFGPTQAAARIETSKRYAKDIMRKGNVPTAHASHHTTVESALRAANALGAPVVIKASGLAAGKGVIVAETMHEAEKAIRAMLAEGALGEAGSEILIEEYMEGEELSIFAICDGSHACLMLGAQDHKRLEEGDVGPNTGGMGAYAPVSLDTRALRQQVISRIIQPTLQALAADGAPFTGLLYAGLMLTAGGPRVVEFNCRFGDPETEAILPLMRSSLLEPVLQVASNGSLAATESLEWRDGAAVTTVVAAHGYPAQVRTGDRITFPPPEDNVYVFHAGTRVVATSSGVPTGEDPPVQTAGGRVLAVTAVAPTLAGAARKSRIYAERVQFEGKQLRGDIGWRELARHEPRAHRASGVKPGA